MFGLAVPDAHAQGRPASPAVSASAVIVTIAPRNRLFVGEKAVAPERLVGALRRLAEPDDRILLRADRRVRYADVMATLDRLNAAGFRRIALVASPPD